MSAWLSELSRFDLFFAVFAPFVVLTYAYFNFQLDREVFRTREETLTPGSFGRIARLFADPIEISVFRLGFQNVQLLALQKVAIKCFLNVIGLFKWHQITTHLVRLSHVNHEPRVQRKFYSSRHICIGATVIIALATATFALVARAIVTSVANCASYPQCGLISYQWAWDNSARDCPCLVFIDRDLAPKTFGAWMDPPDTSQALAQLAKSGYLETVQVINRKVAELPEELRQCTNLRYL